MPQLTELMAAGQTVIADEDGDFPDWIEIHNPGAAPLAMEGWTLSDDAAKPSKFRLPARTIPPGGYLLVFCSEKNRAPVVGALHTNFRLDDAGETLTLRKPDGSVAATLVYPLQMPDVSFDGADFFAEPTPGAANLGARLAIARAPEFSEPRGFKARAFSLTLTCATPGAEIRYTLDGTEPTASSPRYSQPLRITRTTSVRAVAFAPGLRPSPVVTSTYLFTADMVKQSPSGKAPVGWPRSWGANHVDYGMDPRIAARGRFAKQLPAALRDIPTIAITMPLADLFDASTGIYANPGNKGRDWERAASIELIRGDGTPGFQVNAGLRIRGGASRDPGNPKHSFRVLLRKEYGAAALEYPLFGPEGAQRIERFDLRCEQLIAWHYFVDPKADFIRDIYGRDTQGALGQPYKRGDFYHLTINGQYWGMYQTDERVGAEYAAEYFGGRESDYDTVKINYDNDIFGGGTDFVDGSFGAWRRAVALGVAGFEKDANYFAVQGQNLDGSRNPALKPLIDVDNLIDYMLAGIYIAADDSPPAFGTQNNWYAVRSRKGDFGFRFFAHDWEISMMDDTGEENRVGEAPLKNPFFGGGGWFPFLEGVDLLDEMQPMDPTSVNPWHFWQGMRMNAEFRLRVADRVQRHFFNGGALVQEAALERWRQRMEEIDLAIIGESARWGDARRNDGGIFFGVGDKEDRIRAAMVVDGVDEDDVFISKLPGKPGGPISEPATAKPRPKPFTRDDWLKACNERVLGGFLANRSANVLQHLRDGGLFPALDAPSIAPFGGVLAPGALVTMVAPIISSSPVAVAEVFYTLDGSDPRKVGGDVSPGARRYTAPFSLARRTTVKARARHEGQWSALVEAVFEPGVDYSGLRITELHYNPGAPLGDAVEFIELKNQGATPLDLGGLRIANAVDHEFPPGTTLAPGALLVLVRDAAAFSAQYPGVPVGGVFSGKLSDDGETIELQNASRLRIFALTYDDDGEWPLAADGYGHTLVYDGRGDPDAGKNWQASAVRGGSPGEDDTGRSKGALPLVLSEVYEAGGAWRIEIENRTTETLQGTGWKLRSGNSEVALDGVQFPPGAYTILADTQLPSLPAVGGAITLQAPVPFVGRDAVQRLRFGPLLSGASYGRVVTSEGREFFPALALATPAGANAMPSLPGIKITEIFYMPSATQRMAGDDVEFVEIKNNNNVAANLAGARLVGLGYVFPSGAEIPRQGCALVVTGDPAAFRARYAVPAEVQIFGPASGTLQDDGERVALEIPVTTAGGAAFFVVEEVRYNDRGPWPVLAAGRGHSLQRYRSVRYAPEPSSWGSEAPSPGRENEVNAKPIVTLTVGPQNPQGEVILEAQADDPDGTIVGVDLIADGSVFYSAPVSRVTHPYRIPAGIHDVWAVARDERGGMGMSEAVMLTRGEMPDGFGTGLMAEYFTNLELGGDPAHTELVSDVGGDWFHIDPAPGVSRRAFSARYRGSITALTSGEHTFILESNGGLRLFINETLVINAWEDAGSAQAEEVRYSLMMRAGEPVAVRIEYFDRDGFAALVMRWQEPFAFDERPVPVSLWYPPGVDVRAAAIALPAGLERRFAGQRVNAQLAVMNAPVASTAYAWSVRSGALPPGLALTADGRLQGVPQSPGVFGCILQALAPGQEALFRPVSIRIVDRKVAPPRVTILSPKPKIQGQQEVSASGIVKASARVALVRYSLNGGAWHVLSRGGDMRPTLLEGELTFLSNSLPWSVLLTRALGLQGGENRLLIEAQDVDGRSSGEVEYLFTLRYEDILNVQISGAGTVTPGFLGQSQRVVGDRYVVTATPAPGYLFSRWESSGEMIDANRARLSFVMRDALTLTAIFVPNPYLTMKGTYTGAVGEEIDRHAYRGRLILVLGAMGEFSGSLRMRGSTQPFRGRFDPSGFAYLSLNDTAMSLNYNLVLRASQEVAGALEGNVEFFADNSFQSLPVNLRRIPWNARQRCPEAGMWNGILPPGFRGAPQGTGVFRSTVSGLGAVRVIGAMPDESRIRDGAWVDGEGEAHIHAVLVRDVNARRTASLNGTLNFGNDRISGALLWSAQELGGGIVIPLRVWQPGDGIIIPPPSIIIPLPQDEDLFARSVPAEGWRYRVPQPGKSPLNLTDGTLRIAQAGYDSFNGVPVRFNPAFALLVPETLRGKISLLLDSEKGMAYGEIVRPTDGVVTRLRGVCDQINQRVIGFFQDGRDGSGTFVIEAP